jgi:hypothetical protein
MKPFKSYYNFSKKNPLICTHLTVIIPCPYQSRVTMATTSVQKGGAFRSSVVLKSSRAIDPDKAIPPARLPPPVSCKDVTATPTITIEGTPLSNSSDIAEASANGDQPRPKEEDHYGFLYSMSERDQH